MKKVKAATLEELQEPSWLPDAVAEELWNRLHRPVAADGSRITPGAVR